MALIIAWAGLCVLAASASPGGAEPSPARRVASLVPAATELLVGLDATERLVAVDRVSHALPGVGPVPILDAAAALSLEADLLLVPSEASRLSLRARRVIVVAPHDFDEAYAACLEIGAALGLEAEARRYVRDATRPLATLTAESFGRPRPRVATVLGVAPLRVAGGHSFATDLIELAGGESVSHGAEAFELAWSPEQLRAAAPDLIVVLGPEPADATARAQARELLGAIAPLEFLTFDPLRSWFSDALPAARRLRGWVTTGAGTAD
jgi:ABC-type Fe3+-hydroxamate transport system substrate-binding protein